MFHGERKEIISIIRDTVLSRALPIIKSINPISEVE